jgi:hypothetical protein
MSYDRDRDRPQQPIAGPPEGGRSGEYNHPFHPDQWDQAPPAPYRPQGRPPAQSQADGFASRRGDDGESGRGARGQYAGRGPKGYRRSDERIQETVNEALERDGDLDASEISVSVKDGEVTLEGSVPNRWSKRLAEDLVHDRPGVNDVHNRLRVADRGDGR